MNRKITTLLALSFAGCATPQYRSTANFATVGDRAAPVANALAQTSGSGPGAPVANARGEPHTRTVAPLPSRETLDAVYEGLAESCLGGTLDFPQAPQPLDRAATAHSTSGIRAATRVLVDALCEHVHAAESNAGASSSADTGTTTAPTAPGGATTSDARALLQAVVNPQTPLRSSTSSISLAPIPINEQVLMQLIQHRVRQAELLALQDILARGVRGAFAPSDAGVDVNVPYVLRDLTASIAGLLAPTSNASVDAQQIAKDVLKVGLVYSLATAAQAHTTDCSGDIDTPGEAAMCLNLCRGNNCNEALGFGLDAVSVVHAIAGQSLRRAHLVAMLRSVDAYLDATIPDECADGAEPCESRDSTRRALRAKNLLLAFTAAVRAGIREEVPSNGVAGDVRLVLDVPATVTSLLAAYSNERYPGWYLRATIGAGYIYNHAARGPEAALYEEIGAGYRWTFANDRFAHGPHVVVSGLLHSLVLSGNTSNSVFGGGGYSFNFYRLIDLSVNAGAMFDRANDMKPAFAFTFGLQIPLIDYIEALVSGSDAPQVTTAPSTR